MIASELEAYKAAVQAADVVLFVLVLVLIVAAYLLGHRDGYEAGQEDAR